MPAALDRNYDGIIIGAGHHGLVLGSYLSRCGLDILLVDRRLQYGGALVTEEVTAPGFYHNLHSINHFHISETPWFKDLGLASRFTYITPRYEFGQPHLDGSALVFGRDLEERSPTSRASPRGTPRPSGIGTKGRGDHGPHFPAGAFSEPPPRAKREALLSISDSDAIFSRRRSASRSTFWGNGSRTARAASVPVKISLSGPGSWTPV